MREQPSYYAILTADVRYDKNLSANAKLLYAEITALSQKEGFAWASNQYFAELYEVHKDTISSWVSELVRAGYIQISVDKKAGNLRKIIIKNAIGEKTEGIGKNAYTYRRKDRDPIGKNADIIIQDNNKKNTAFLANKLPTAEHRGKPSHAKERLREMVKSGRLKELKNV